MGRKDRGSVASELYTTEAGESKKRAKEDQVVPDPTKEEGERAIANAEVKQKPKKGK